MSDAATSSARSPLLISIVSGAGRELKAHAFAHAGAVRSVRKNPRLQPLVVLHDIEPRLVRKGDLVEPRGVGRGQVQTAPKLPASGGRSGGLTNATALMGCKATA